MSYRKHGIRVLIERCFKQTAMKYVDTPRDVGTDGTPVGDSFIEVSTYSSLSA